MNARKVGIAAATMAAAGVMAAGVIASGLNADAHHSTRTEAAASTTSSIGPVSTQTGTGNALLKGHSWNLPAQLGWSSTYKAESVTLTQLPVGDLMALDEELARSLDGAAPPETQIALPNDGTSRRARTV